MTQCVFLLPNPSTSHFLKRVFTHQLNGKKVKFKKNKKEKKVVEVKIGNLQDTNSFNKMLIVIHKLLLNKSEK